MLHKHVLVDHFRKDLSIIDIDTSDVLLVSFYLTKEERRHQKYDNNEEHNQNLDLVVDILQESWQGDSNSHGALAVWVSVFEEIFSGFFISHNLSTTKYYYYSKTF